ncbi:hypothetical protein KXD40_001321 [Peronospora effusa]|uniref:PX domain-containing protein n=1 Tax=Peronospora effusa TaxID=542832 RepID=A0A3M6VLQ0_9STRA|nr:hypothetical protein DD238_000337 [Peronospora effusa]RQM18100.1 hypothetical protein DD237_000403 [Peronospora effusa]UIZ21630.1 hypothetical protein KXD40_001321 [Peronospora effusa]CAI5704279.1 unnamed protein product [Peronospora effusa]
MVMQSVLTTTPSCVLHTTITHVSKSSISGAHTHTQFLVRVSDERSPDLNWTVYRRYSEFRNFKLALEKAIKSGDMCAHCVIMSKRTCFVLFPRRRLFSNLREKTLETRCAGLNMFLHVVAKHARTCRESMTCQTRLLMDKFLLVNDMRYTYLNVDMSETDGEGNSTALGKKNLSMSGLTHRSSSMVSRFDRPSNHSYSRDEAVRSCTGEWMHTSDELATDSQEDQFQVEASMNEDVDSQQQDANGLVVKRNRTSNLLSYSNDRRPRTHSWNDDTQLSAVRQSLTTERERPAYKQQSNSSTSRHSDPGLARNELLNFTRGSFSGGGRPLRAEGRPRSRKVHLSSAAKRVKKLEEAEARFSVQAQTRKPKCVPRLAPIPEED